MLLHATATEYGVRFETGQPVQVRFVRATTPAPKPAPSDPYQQKLEPAGRYMVHNPDPGQLPAGWEQGSVTFQSPLVVAFNSGREPRYDARSWKAALAQLYGARGEKLSRAVASSGYDGIVTVWDGGTREIIDLTWAAADMSKRRKTALGCGCSAVPSPTFAGTSLTYGQLPNTAVLQRAFSAAAPSGYYVMVLNAHDFRLLVKALDLVSETRHGPRGVWTARDGTQLRVVHGVNRDWQKTAVQLDFNQLIRLLAGLTTPRDEVYEDDGEASEQLASSILQTLGFEWV
jgi:hypothetical protein